MRFVSHWPLGVPLLFLAYLPRRKPPLMRYKPVHRLHKRRATGRWELWLFRKWRLLPRLPGGTRPGRGSRKPSVFTDTRGHGMRSVTSTAVRHTAGACSSWWRRGRVSGVWSRRSMGLRRRALVSSYSGHGLSIDATATRGASGGRRELAAYGEAA